MRKEKMRRGTAWIACAAMMLTVAGGSISVHADSADSLSTQAMDTPEIQQILDEREQERYVAYRQSYADAAMPLETLELPLDQAEITGDVQYVESGLDVLGQGTAKWTVEAATAGLYKCRIAYEYRDAEAIQNALMDVVLNGEVPYIQAEEITLKRLWENDTFKTDIYGNDIKPTQKQVLAPYTTDLIDETGGFRELYFYLSAGENQVELRLDGEDLHISGVAFYNDEVQTYEEYLTEQPDAADVANTYIKTYQAEQMDLKSDSSLVAAVDRSGPATVPSDPVKLKRNIVSGSSFSMPGQWLSWEIEIPADGYYKFGMRAKQSDSEGMAVTRRIMIDGKLLFSEMGDWSIPYSDSWDYYEMGGDTPWLVYLKAGTYTLSMEVVTGESGELSARLEDVIYLLNYLYRKIIVITGTDPDLYRDYTLEQEIPELLPIFAAVADELDDIAERAEEINGERGGQFSILGQMSDQLRAFVEDATTIPERLESYKSNVSALSSLMLSLQTQPLNVDYITVLGADAVMEETEAGFFASAAYHIQAFIGSFFSDYVALSGETTGAAESITAWYNGGREQAELIKQIIDSDFTPESGIAVTLELVQVPVAQAILAGNAPDVVLNIARGQPVNLAARGALVDLSTFEGADELEDWFIPGGLDPYTYQGGLYGIPITMDFHMMFYRKDILEDLGVEPPETWEELYEIIPIIQRNNMMVGLPYTVLSSQVTIDSGMGAKDLYPTLLMQHGGSFFNDDGASVALDTPEAVAAFQEWVSFYTIYGFELQYDFYNRFRTGEVPIGIQNYSMYNQLSAAAPELKGLWDFTLIPGTLREDGTIDRSEAASGTAAVMLETSENQSAAWKFLKWWSGAEAQSALGLELETLMGSAARYNPANLQAMEQLPWSDQQLDTLRRQMEYVREIPEVVGGYYVSRGLDNAFRNVLFNEENYRESLMEQIVKMNDELKRKQDEMAKKQ